jgi:type II secretory pathway component PulJ
MIKRPSNRRGYALLLVLIFVVLFTAILGVAWRRVASALRIERASEVRKQCDQGSIQALAQAMQFLETCLRRNSPTTARINGDDGSKLSYAYQSNNLPPPSKTQWYLIDFVRDNPDGSEWSVSVTTSTDDHGLAHLPSAPP